MLLICLHHPTPSFIIYHSQSPPLTLNLIPGTDSTYNNQFSFHHFHHLHFTFQFNMVTCSASFLASKPAHSLLTKSKDSPWTASKKAPCKKTEEPLSSTQDRDLSDNNSFPKVPAVSPNQALATHHPATASTNAPHHSSTPLSCQSSSVENSKAKTTSAPSTPKHSHPTTMALQPTPPRNNCSLASQPFWFYFNLLVMPKASAINNPMAQQHVDASGGYP